jgi:predicted HicB family RNase H-like nuclease
MFDCDQFDDGRGRYPGRLTVHVRRGLRETIYSAASRRGVSAAELVRQILDQGVSSECSASASGAQSSRAENGGQ